MNGQSVLTVLPRHSRFRRGYSLAELLVVIAIGGTLMGTATATLYTMFEAEKAARDQLLAATTLDRLAAQFRCDAHEADRAGHVGPKAGQPAADAWEFRLGGPRTVEYRGEAGSLVRLERDQGRIVAREEYTLGHGAQVSIESEPAGRPPLAVLRIATPADATPGSPRRIVRIEAALGFAVRFTETKEADAHGSKPNAKP